MRCPECQHDKSQVVDSRTTEDGCVIRRRRRCADCGARYTTHERIEARVPWVRKKDGRREPFSREKVLHGIALACRKRPIDDAGMMEAVRRVEARLIALREPDVEASKVGEACMAVLRDMDPVAYVRFASVYREFEDVDQFVEAILPLTERG